MSTYISKIMPSCVMDAAQSARNVYEGIKNPPYQELDAKLAQAESYLNKFGYIPGISIVSGTCREYFGYVEVLLGVSSGALRNIAAQLIKDEDAKKRLYEQAEIDFSYAINGLGNIVRGNIEKFAYWDLWALAINKLVLMTYDLIQIRMNYGHETEAYKHPILRSFINEGTSKQIDV